MGSRFVERGAKTARPAAAPSKAHPSTALTIPQDEHEAKVLAEALKKKPDHTPLLFRLAQLAEQAGKRADAASYLRKILANEKDNTDARLELGKVLFEMGDSRGAIEQTKAILEKHPAHPDALYNLGAVYANLGDARTARQYWDRLLAVDPRSESAQRAKAMLPRLPSNAL